MTSPRTPKQWGPGNSEPDRYLVLADLDGDLITYNRDEDGDCTVGWRYVRVDGCAVSLPGVPWSDFDDEFDVSWPLSEVLPETPEPPQEGCCGACSGKGHVQGEACSDCLSSGHAHDPDDPCPAPEPATEADFAPFAEEAAEFAAICGYGPVLRRCPNDDFPIRDEEHGCPRCNRPVPASQSVPAVPVSSTRGKETGEAAETATEALSDPKVELTKTIAETASIPQWRAALVASFLIEEGWRPPLPDSETERPRRCPALTPESDLITAGRQCQQYEGHAHDHTWYGDNGYAYSAWRVTS